MNQSSVQKSQQQVLQMLVSMSDKLSKWTKQFHQMSVQLLKSFTGNDRHERYNKRSKDKQKQKQDLNSNLINQQDQDDRIINGNINGRKKIKIKNRIQQAQQENLEFQNHIEQKKQIIHPKLSTNQINKTNNNKKHIVQDNHNKHNQKDKLLPPQPQKIQDNRKKIKPISHKPKAPTSSFLLFFKQQQQSIAKSYPNYGVVELTKVAAKCWNQLSVQEKQPYQKLFEVQRKKYQQEMEKYRREFPQQVRLKQLEKKEKKKKKAKQRRQRQVKQPKQKNIPIVSNNQANAYHQITPYGAVKLQDLGVIAPQQRQEQIQHHQHFIKNQQEVGSDEIGSLNGDSQENSLGEDI